MPEPDRKDSVMHAEEASFVSGRTRLFGIVGDPIEQVRSPEMFSGEFVRRGLEALMIPVHVLPGDFEACLAQLKRVQNIDGLVFTIPYKQAAMKLADTLGTQARTVGAINALARRPDGHWIGDIFDGLGCVEAFRRRQFALRDQRLMLIGAGGAGSAIGVAIAHEGPRSVRVFDTDQARAADLAAKMKRVNPEVDVTTGSPVITGIDILLNASPVGMLGDPRMPVDISSIAPEVIVFDAIVKPEPTRFLAMAQQRGCRTVFGREMMRGQIARMIDFFTGSGT
jgi:shikimate dehydrogenase